MEWLWWATDTFDLPFLPYSHLLSAGFPGGTEAESRREAEGEKKVARESQSCKGEAGTKWGDTCIAAHWVCDTASLSKNKELPKGTRPLCLRARMVCTVWVPKIVQWVAKCFRALHWTASSDYALNCFFFCAERSSGFPVFPVPFWRQRCF